MNELPLAVRFPSVLLGALVLAWATWGVLVPRRRFEASVVGAAGLLGGAVAASAYALYSHFVRGVELHWIPRGQGAEWFVSVFGWLGGLAALSFRLFPAAWRRFAERHGVAGDPSEASRGRHGPET